MSPPCAEQRLTVGAYGTGRPSLEDPDEATKKANGSRSNHGTAAASWGAVLSGELRSSAGVLCEGKPRLRDAHC